MSDWEEYIDELYKEFNISKAELLKYIKIVGTNKENIRDYALNVNCAVVRKEGDFNVEYTACMLNEKDQRISELEEQLANSISPKFPRQEHICGFEFGEIREYIVVAYLDNNVTLCENIETSELEWCDNNFLVRTFEEAQERLKELTAKNV